MSNQDRGGRRPPVLDGNGAEARSPEQAGHEAALREVSETILNIEAAIQRPHRARSSLVAGRAEPNLVHAMSQVIEDLETAQRTLHQRTYLAADQQAMF